MTKRITLSLLALFTIVGFAFGQDDKEYSEMSLEELLNLEISTASAVKENASEAPATTYVITSQDITERGYQRLLDVLEDIPEFEVQLKSDSEFGNDITTRGVQKSNHLLLLLNGARITSGAATLQNIDYNYDVRYADKIEIVMGPASAVYGADAFSGVINIITSVGSDLKGIAANVTYGNFGTTSNSVRFGVGNENISLSGGGSYYGSNEPVMPDFYRNEYAWYRERYATDGQMFLFGDTVTVPKSAWAAPRKGGSAFLRLNVKDFEVQAYYNAIDYSSSTAVRPELSLSNSSAQYGYNMLGANARHQFTSLTKTFTAEHSFSYVKYELNPQSNFQNQFTGFGKGYKYARNSTAQVNGIYSLKFDDVNRLNFGWTYKHVDALPKTTDLPFVFDPNVSGNQQGMYQPGSNIFDSQGRDLSLPVDFYNYQESTAGLFAQYQAALMEKIFLIAGARFDYNSRFGAQFNPRLGFVYKASDHFRLRATYGEAFLSASPENLYGQYGSFAPDVNGSGDTIGLRSFFLNLPNPNLKPEKVRSIDVNLNVLAGDFSIALSSYYNAINNKPASTVSSGTFRGIPVYTIQKTENIGNAFSYGGSLRVAYKKSFGDISVNAYASYTYSQGKASDDNDGEELINSAFHTGKAGLVFKWNRLSVSPRLIYSSGVKPAHDISFVEPPYTPSYLLLNAHVAYTFVEANSKEGKPFGVSGFFTIRNATNARYYNGFSSVASDAIYSTPQDPFRFVAGVNVVFTKKEK